MCVCVCVFPCWSSAVYFKPFDIWGWFDLWWGGSAWVQWAGIYIDKENPGRGAQKRNYEVVMRHNT